MTRTVVGDTPRSLKAISDSSTTDIQLPTRVLIAASVGTFVEYFDLVSFGALAGVLSTVFFPGTDETAGLLNTFAVFALAYIARPLGGLFWGPLGDRIGRKRTLATIIIIMTVATTLSGLLPSYASVGLWSPVLLVMLRFVQGISAGGELPGAAIYIGEYSSNTKRAYRTSFLSFALTFAQLSALLLAAILTATLSTEALRSWGWRIPFLLALPIGTVGLYIRSQLEETPAFEHIEEVGAKSKSPIAVMVGSLAGWRMIGRATLFNLPVQVPGFILFTFMPSFLIKTAHLSPGRSLALVTIASVVLLLLQPVGGRLSDHYGRRPMLFVVGILNLALAYPAFAFIQMGGTLYPALGLIFIAILHGLGTGTQLAPVMESFPTQVRYTGFAVSIGLIVAFIGGNTAYIAQWLVNHTGNTYSPAWLIMLVVVPCVLGAFFVRETNGRDLPE